MSAPRMVGNRYELAELIGYGGMAEVHRGRDIRLGREVAVKVLRADLARDQTFLNRFRREAQSAAGLNHPSIVAVYDTGEDESISGPVPYIVMEFVEGRTLRDVLKAAGRLPAPRAMEIVSEVCAALDFSHRNGIVHRDIKPANVMITNAGAVKVMDFGIARALSNDAATVTQTAAVIGTAQYLSPEQARGESVDARSDVYSTGCLLYELVTGAPPFTGDSPVAVAYQHVRETAPSPSSINPEVPRALDSIVMKALAKNPVNRYQSAADMRADLQRALASRPVEAEAVMTDDEKTQIIGRPGQAPRLTGPVVGLGGDDPAADEDRGRRGAVIWTAVVVALLLVIGAGAYAVVALGKSDKPKTIAVPSVVGQNVSAAQAALLNQGFTNVPTPANYGGPCGIDPVTSPVSKPTEGTICTQDPAPNTKIAKDAQIKLTVYKKPTVTVPSVIGQMQAEATNALQTAGLKVTPKPVNSSQPAGTVIDQNPASGTTVAPASSVTISVSTGTVVLPNVVGRPVADAVKALNQAGWTQVDSSKTIATTDKTKNGLVQAETPNPNIAYVQTTTSVQLIVYRYQLPPCPSSPPPSSSSSSSSSSSPPGIPGSPGAPSTKAAPSTTPPPSTSNPPTGPPTCTS